MRAIVRDDAALDGAPRLDGTRLGVLPPLRGPEEIAADYDGVSVADVHGALAVAFDNPEEMRALEQAGQEAIERIRGGRPVDPTGST